MGWPCRRSIPTHFVSDTNAGALAPTGSNHVNTINSSSLMEYSIIQQNYGIRAVECWNDIKGNVHNVFKTNQVSRNKIIFNLKLGAGNPWAGHSSVIEWFNRRSMPKNFTSLTRVGALAPTGSAELWRTKLYIDDASVHRKFHADIRVLLAWCWVYTPYTCRYTTNHSNIMLMHTENLVLDNLEPDTTKRHFSIDRWISVCAQNQAISVQYLRQALKFERIKVKL